MKKYINRIKNSTYIMQIITLMSGTLIAQVLMLISLPVLTRLYTPSEFGLYSLFLSIIIIFGAVSSLKYDQAIMLPKSHIDAQALVFLSSIITFVITILSIVIILIFYNHIINYFDNNILLIFLIPFGIFITGMVQIFNAYSSRNQYYKTLSTVRVLNASTIISIQGISKYFFKLDGLVVGKLIADFISLIVLIQYHFKKQTLQLNKISKKRMEVNLKRYKHFPKFQSITVFLNSISQNIPILLLTSLYSPDIAGFYALTIRILQAPIGLIGGATREVYYQRASKMFANGDSIFSLYYKTTISLLKLFILPFVIVILFGDNLFSLIFGNEWVEAGIYSQILIFWFLFLFINSPSIMTFSILGLQKIQMKLEIISVLLRFFSIYLGFYFFNSAVISIVLFTITSILVNIFVIAFIYFKLKNPLYLRRNL